MEILGYVLWMTSLNIFFWTVLNFGVAYAIRLLPSRFFSENQKIYQEHPFEKNFYKSINVSKWKHKLPDAGKLIRFYRNKLPKEIDLSYLNRFIKECCIAEIGHLLIGLLGYLSLLFVFLLPAESLLWNLILFALIATINLIIQLLFVIIQRYNRPRLILLRNHYHLKLHNLNSEKHLCANVAKG